ncbi:MAG TPA: sugar transferase, partial [Bacteroidota bacterium]|nr:sugar transferase [Bacteroidota bacterium]
DIDYNIDKPSHRFVKRFLDIVCAILLTVTVYPFVQGRKRSPDVQGKFGKKMLLVPEVLLGRMSFVGPPEFSLARTRSESGSAPVFLGLPGITGLVQINFREDLSTEEIEKYNLYYAKNQTVTLDIEILMKSFILLLKK